MKLTNHEYDRAGPMKLANYEWVPDPGNPLPVDAIALVFREGRACVMVRVRGLEGWHEAMSAPTPADAEESLACDKPLRRYKQDGRTFNDGTPQEWGDYGDNRFCGLTCGWRWACRNADMPTTVPKKAKK